MRKNQRQTCRSKHIGGFKLEFRRLRADEIECRINSISQKGGSFLLYKDARCDMNLLDETVGPENWQRKHTLINGNLFCSVGIYCDEEWVWKEDVGTESRTEATKGEASDAFKRACTNWGIGRELYTAPFIWISADGFNIEQKNGKLTTNDRFRVKSIGYDERGNISSLSVENVRRGKVVFSMGEANKSTPTEEKAVREPINVSQDAMADAEARAKIISYVNKTGMNKENVQKLCKYYRVESLSQLTLENCNHYIDQLHKKGIEI